MSAQRSRPSDAAPSSDPIASSASTVKTSRRPALSPRDAVELAELLERVYADVRVGADAHPDASMQYALNRQEAVAEIRLGRRARADPRAALGEQVELVPVGVRRVHDRRARAEAAAVGEELDRPETVLGEALLDLARLFVRVDVQGQLVFGARIGQALRASHAGMRERSGGQRRRGCLPRAALRGRAGIRRPTPAGNGRCRRARRRRRAERSRSPRPRPPPPQRAPPRGRDSGTRRRRCSRRPAAPGRSRHSSLGPVLVSDTGPGPAWTRATPRSRRPPSAHGERAGRHGNGRRQNRGAGKCPPRARGYARAAAPPGRGAW